MPGEPLPADTELKYDLYLRAMDENGLEIYQRVNLCGFSYFLELAGLSADRGIELWSLLDPEATEFPEYPKKLPPPILSGGKYGMMFEDYLDRLQAYKINFCRLFVFPLFDFEYTPYGNKDGHKYDLENVSTVYLDRLSEFIKNARDRGIIVCLSLFSSQMLKKDTWDFHPFNVANNTTGNVDPKAGYFGDEDGQPLRNGLGLFCNVNEGSPPANAQKTFVTQIVNRTMPYWNVIYEIFNEPGNKTIPVANATPWIKMVAGWINDLLKVGTGTRARLIAITSLDELLPELMAALLPQDGPLVDVFSFHGEQWGGESGKSDEACTGTHDISVDDIKAGETEVINQVTNETYHHPGINDAIKRFHVDSNYSVALIFDSDSLYWAQKEPANYVQACLEKRASFNYRWSADYLNTITGNDCNEFTLDCGLVTQRLTKIAAGQAAAGANPENAVTVFPAFPAAVEDLAVSVDGSYMIITFKPPDVIPDGYVAYFGPTAETVGQGKPPAFPPSRYFNVDDPQHPRFIVAFDAETLPSEVFVAVSAKIGFLTGECSDTFRVSIPAAAQLLNAEVNFDQAKTSLPIGEIETRDFNLRVTFVNTGPGSWRTGIKNFSDYVISQKLFVLAPAANRQLFRKALAIPAGQTDVEILSNAAAHSYELISLACDGKTPSGNPVPEGTIIRADVRLEPDTEHENRLHRVVRISHTSPEPLTVDAWAVIVDKQDLQYEQRVLDYITVFNDKPALSINLGALEYKFEISSLYSTQKLKRGAVEYYSSFRSSGATKKRLHVGITGAPADAEEYVQLEMRVVEVLENMGYLQFDSRQHEGQIIDFEPGDGLTQYSKMSDGAVHNFQVVKVASIDDVPLRYGIVLRANASGDFERALEVTRDDTTIDGRVPYYILEVPLDVTSVTARQAASIKQDHARRILDFFNNAQTADEITYGISDNPGFGPRSRKAFSIRHKLAQRILETRGSLPARRFESLEQIDKIRGVGKDTFEDIAYTFEDDKSDDRK